MLVAAIVGCGPLAGIADRIRMLEHKEELTERENKVQIITFVLVGLLLMWCMIRLAGGSYNPFIYFRF
jgi:alginate O-acetyltransferase complex protein AlgI